MVGSYSVANLFCADDSGGIIELHARTKAFSPQGYSRWTGSTRWLDLCHAAIDAEFDAGHEAAVIGGQKQCGGRDFFGAAQPVEWYRRGELCLVGLSVQHGSVDRARAQRVKPDAAAVGLPGPGAGIGPRAVIFTRACADACG